MTTTDLLRDLIESAIMKPDLVGYLERQEWGDAGLFDQLFSGRAAFDHSERRWFLWQGLHWKADVTGQVLHLVGDELPAEYLRAAMEARSRGDKELSQRFSIRATQLCSHVRMSHVLDLASKQPHIRLEGSEWENPPMLLPVANGVVDLSNGSFRQATPRDYLRAYAASDWYGLDCAAPRWERFMLEIFGGDLEMTGFVQRLLGYAITGDTREQILPILWGGGSNGKSTMVDTLSSVIGPDLCFTTQSDSLMDTGRTDGNGARPFVTALRNKRVAWASEGREGGRLNVGLIKQLTGDGYITARPLYGSPITFPQTYQVFLVTNHLPRFPDGGDDALWRRVLLIPFNERFVEGPKSPREHGLVRGLSTDLRSEGPGILAWLVRGCMMWQESGLHPPVAVTEGTLRYRLEEDLIGQFVSDRLSADNDREATAGAIYESYKAWCEDSGNRPVSARVLGQRMTARFGGSVLKRIGDRPQRIYRGVGVVR